MKLRQFRREEEEENYFTKITTYPNTYSRIKKRKLDPRKEIKIRENRGKKKERTDSVMHASLPPRGVERIGLRKRGISSSNHV